MPAALPLIAGAFLAGGAIATAVGITTAFVIAGITISLAAVLTITGVALLAVAYLARKTPKPDSGGQQLKQKLDPQAPVPILYGRSATGGYITWRGTWGAKNAFYGIVTVLSAGGPIAGIEAYKAGDYNVGFSGNPAAYTSTVTNVGGYSGSSKLYKNKLQQRWQSGEAPANTTPGGASGFPIPAGAMSGLAHAITRYEFSNDAFPQGLPSSLWTASGVKLYDPRKDSTYPGGSGAQRLDQPSTWAFSENPFLAALQWTLGRYENGHRVYGIGAKWAEVDVASFVNGANVADANGWKVGGVVTTDDDKYAVLASLLASGGGVPVARGAQIACTVNAPKTSVLTLTKEDIIGEVEISSTTSYRDRQNTIIPKYREETQGWEIVAGEQISAAQYIAEDGGEQKTVEIEFPLVQQAAQAHQLATYELCNSREFLTFTVNTKLRLLAVRVGDAITVNVPQIGAGSRKCTVTGREFNPTDLSVTLSLKSETDAKHAFALGQSQVAPPAPKLDGYDPSNPGAPAANAWAVTATQISNGTTTLPVIVVTGAVDDPNTATVIVEYRPTGSSTWLNYGEFARTTTRVEVSGLTDGTAYDVALSYRTVLGVVGDRLVLSATAGAFKVSWSSTVSGTGKPTDFADVTRDNTSRDTAAVNGTPAGTVITSIATANTNADKALANQKDSGGNIVTVTSLLSTISAGDAKALSDAKSQLAVDIAAARQEGTSARQEAATAQGTANQARTDLATEVTRAKGAEGTLTTNLASVKQTADTASAAVTDEATVRARDDASLAARQSVTEARSGSPAAMNANGTFARYSAATGTPDLWGYDNQTNGGASRITRPDGSYALSLVSQANTPAYAGQSLPPVSANTFWVLDAEIKLVAGTLNGAGVLFRAGTDYRLTFTTDPDSSGSAVGVGVAGKTYRFTKLVRLSVASNDSALWYMNHWAALGDIASSNTIEWYRCVVRPATSSEIAADRADINASSALAKITQNDTTYTNSIKAVADRETVVESQLAGTTGSGVLTKINDNYTTLALADSGLATRQSATEASFSRIKESLLPANFNGQTTDWGADRSGIDWYFEDHQTRNDWSMVQGLVMAWSGTGYCYIYPRAENTHQLVPVTSGQKFRLTASVGIWSGTGQNLYVYFDVHGLDRGYRGNAESFSIVPPNCVNHVNIGVDNEWHEITTEITVPNNAAFIRPILYVNGGGGFVRWIKLERSEAIALTDARVTDNATTAANATKAVADRATTVEAQLAGTTGSTILTKINDNYTTLALADSGLATRISTTEASATNTGNLVPNTSFQTLDGWTLSYAPNGAVIDRNRAGEPWQIGGVENNLTLFQSANGGGLQAEALSSPFAVKAGEYYQVQSLTASHRCRAWVSMHFYDANGNGTGYAGENFGTRINAGGQDINAHDISGIKVVTPPAGTVRARMAFRMYDVQNDGYVWFHRPSVTVVKSNTNQWNAYAPGSDRGVIAATNAKVSDNATTAANATKAVADRATAVEAQLRGDTGSNLLSRITDNYSTLAGVDSALAIRVSTTESTASNASGNLIPNNTYSAWPDGQEIPTKWEWWQRNYVGQRIASGRTSGGYAYRVSVGAADNGIAQMYGNGPVIVPGYYVMEAEVELVSGSWRNAGLTIQGIYNLSFANESDTAGNVSATATGTRRFTKLVFVTHTDLRNWHPMENWTGFGQGNDAKTLIWYRTILRPASAGEILAKQANTTADAAKALVSTEEATRISQDAALATRATVLEASSNRDVAMLNRNANYSDWPDGQGLPTGLSPSQNGYSYMSKVPGLVGKWAMRHAKPDGYGNIFPVWDGGTGNGDGIFEPGFMNLNGDGWYVVEADVTLNSGTLAGSGVWATMYGPSNTRVNTIDFYGTPTTSGVPAGDGVPGTRYKWAWLFKYDCGSPGRFRLHPMTAWDGFGRGYPAKDITWHKSGIRAASIAEIYAQRVIDANLIARVTSNEGTIATVDGKTQAYFTKVASVPGADAFITAVAKNDGGGATSNVAIGGTSIALYNTENGQAKRAMFLAGGNSVFDGSITANGGILVGTGKLKVQVQAQDYAVSHDQYVSFGYDLGRAPTITFGPCPVALNSGEVYAPYAAELSASGFRAKLLINAAPQSSAQSTGGFSNQGNNVWQVGKGGRPLSANGSYTVTVNLSAVAQAYRDNDYQ